MSQKTLMEYAQSGEIRQEFKDVAEYEKLETSEIMQGVAEGTIVIPKNRVRPRDVKSIGIGKGLSVKVNANIGTSEDIQDVRLELMKLDAAVRAGAHTVMDLSTGGDIASVRKEIISTSPVPIGTVPIYETAVKLRNADNPVVKMSPDDIFQTIENQAKQGVDFMTVHAGVTARTVELLIQSDRVMNVVSRGGSFLIQWILYHQKENPLYEYYDRLLEIARKYEITLSLGDGMRPGAIADATDKPQIEELIVLGELVDRARDAGVQAMVEGPGHIPIHQIETNMKIQKSICRNAPFYVLGPVVTDIAPAYDHITSAIGGAWAAYFGADFLCYVTRTEHLSLPDVSAVREGVIITRIAAHAADIARGVPNADEWDRNISEARYNLDWEKQVQLSIDPEKAEKIRKQYPPTDEDVCTMCGEYCALKAVREALPKKKK
ncbi:phosphomethylpyrimidine synthase [bacterium]|nr:MAG: phosphomethylpyrimidine synthase [bacterium]